MAFELFFGLEWKHVHVFQSACFVVSLNKYYTM